MGHIVVLNIMATIVTFYCGLKIGRILAKKRFMEFLMDGIEDDIKETLKEKIKNDEL